MRLAEFFYGEENDKADRPQEEDENSRVKTMSTFTLSSGRQKCMDL